MSLINNKNKNWKPLKEEKLKAIRKLFADIFPKGEHGSLANKISDYWIKRLSEVWKNKAEGIKDKDRKFNPSDPLSRIKQNTVLIVYADSVSRKGEKSLTTLGAFLKKYFPAIAGLHMLPACVVVEDRFNDGFFSQVVRNHIHKPFGTDRQFVNMMGEYYSMADFVLNHVDIANPRFQAYLKGDDEAGRCFYIFTEDEYLERLTSGDFDKIFRPRPFPLFTIFRRSLQKDSDICKSYQEKVEKINNFIKKDGLKVLPQKVIGLLSIFNKIKNDQMLLAEDYQCIVDFRNYLDKKSIDLDNIFRVSATQETQQTPYIFTRQIKKIENLLEAIGIDCSLAKRYAKVYRKYDPIILGQEIRALTTFSHVQVDLNTSTFEGLEMLADDFLWYLGMDLNMLRLDAANFAFKEWGTSCFGLPGVKNLMKILFLSMDCLSPRNVPNLEINDQLSSILNQMADKKATPPMMYDFHLVTILPVVFNTGDVKILSRIFDMIAQYNISKESIRFSLVESHDGKSVRGSLDLLNFKERQGLIKIIKDNEGYVKYRSVPKRQYDKSEFKEICAEAQIDFTFAQKVLFKKRNSSGHTFYLKNNIDNKSDIAKVLKMKQDKFKKSLPLAFFVNKIIKGREPYELCSSTRDSLTKLKDRNLEARRYLTFYTLAFALMGRNVKAIYFNDLIGLPNDYNRVERSGELRDIKRTKSDINELEKLFNNPDSFEHKIALEMNKTIALLDSDQAFHFRGNEAVVAFLSESVAMVHNFYNNDHSLIIVNIGPKTETAVIDSMVCGWEKKQTLFDNISGKTILLDAEQKFTLNIQPYQRFWLTKSKIKLPSDLLVSSEAYTQG